jgi:hypothetical protein
VRNISYFFVIVHVQKKKSVALSGRRKILFSRKQLPKYFNSEFKNREQLQFFFPNFLRFFALKFKRRRRRKTEYNKKTVTFLIYLVFFIISVRLCERFVWQEGEKIFFSLLLSKQIKSKQRLN